VKPRGGNSLFAKLAQIDRVEEQAFDFVTAHFESNRHDNIFLFKFAGQAVDGITLIVRKRWLRAGNVVPARVLKHIVNRIELGLRESGFHLIAVIAHGARVVTRIDRLQGVINYLHDLVVGQRGRPGGLAAGQEKDRDNCDDHKQTKDFAFHWLHLLSKFFLVLGWDGSCPLRGQDRHPNSVTTISSLSVGFAEPAKSIR
jgi:hypothetical protein